MNTLPVTYWATSAHRRLLHDIGVEHTLLLQIIRNCILRQKRRLEPDFGSDPFPLGVGSIRGVIATATTAKLRAEVGALNLVKLLDLTPGLVAGSSGHIDFQSYDRHPETHSPAETQFDCWAGSVNRTGNKQCCSGIKRLALWCGGLPSKGPTRT